MIGYICIYTYIYITNNSVTTNFNREYDDKSADGMVLFVFVPLIFQANPPPIGIPWDKFTYHSHTATVYEL